MKNPVFALFLVPLLTMPAFAGSLNVADKPLVVAEGADVRIGGVGVVSVSDTGVSDTGIGTILAST